MASLPLPLVPPKVAAEAPLPATEEERQPLVADTEDVPETPTANGTSIEQMGVKESYDKPEARGGDAVARIAAIVRLIYQSLSTGFTDVCAGFCWSTPHFLVSLELTN